MKLNTLIVFLSIPLLTIAAVNKTEKGKPPPIPTESITNLDSLIMTFPVCIYDCMFDLVLIGAETAPQCKLLTGADDEKPDWKCFCSDDSSKYTAADNRTLEAASEKFAICAEEALEDCSTVELENFEVYFNNLDDYCNKILSGSGDKPPSKLILSFLLAQFSIALIFFTMHQGSFLLAMPISQILQSYEPVSESTLLRLS